MTSDELRARIARLGWTYTEAARRLGLSVSGLQHNLRDERPVGRQTEIILDQIEEGQNMVKTTSKGETFPHLLLWEIVEEQAKLASERERDWSRPALVAMVFGFHTVEAYLNFVGERLAPEIWQDERNYFRREPYRGWDGKLRKVMELVGMPWAEPIERPLKTILELRELRDLIAHPKPEKLKSEIIHAEGTEAPPPVSALRSKFTPKTKVITAVHDVEEFLNQVHRLATPKVDDIWFGSEALRGAQEYILGRTTLNQ
jgi:transcriptional regulator with XRE-family HTH domain